jgi:predicted porin
MKKSLLALAVLGAFAGAASAQSSVTIYGSFDGGIRNQSNTGKAGTAQSTAGTKTSVGSTGTYNSNRLGFKGIEDLGGGLNAHFVLETGFNTGTGALNNTVSQLFDRAASVGIGGGWGSLDFGRQYSVSFKTIGTYDPFNYKYTGIVPLATAAAGSQGSGSNPFGFGSTRFNNDIQYSGNFGPVTAYAEYAMGEVSGDNSAGRAAAIGATYANGPLSLGTAYTSRKTSGVLPNATSTTTVTNTFFSSGINSATTASRFENKQWTIGGAYKFGAARVAAGYIDEKQDLSTGGEAKAKNAWTGVSFAITPALELTGAYYQTKVEAPGADGKRQLFIVGTTYALSKRTNFYADIDYNKYKNAAVGYFAPVGIEKQTGVSVGINHLF